MLMPTTRMDVFVLQELERMRLLLDRLQAAGVIPPALAALATLEADARQRERLIALDGLTPEHDAALQDLQRRIAALEASLHPEVPPV